MLLNETQLTLRRELIVQRNLAFSLFRLRKRPKNSAELPAVEQEVGGSSPPNCNHNRNFPCGFSNVLTDLTYLPALKYRERYRWQS